MEFNNQNQEVSEKDTQLTGNENQDVNDRETQYKHNSTKELKETVKKRNIVRTIIGVSLAGGITLIAVLLIKDKKLTEKITELITANVDLSKSLEGKDNIIKKMAPYALQRGSSEAGKVMNSLRKS